MRPGSVEPGRSGPLPLRKSDRFSWGSSVIRTEIIQALRFGIDDKMKLYILPNRSIEMQVCIIVRVMRFASIEMQVLTNRMVT